MKDDFTDKVAVVTGASRGLGRRVSEALAQRGARVALVSRNKASLEETAAALGHLQSIEEAEDQLLQEEVATNLLGPIYCMRAAIPLMRAVGGGDLINITSESTRNPYPFLAVYAATKSAVETVSAGLRTELRGENIRVTVLRSGRLTESGFNRDWPEAQRARYRELVTQQGYYAASGEPISPQITAQAIVDLIGMPRAACVDCIELRPS